MISIRWIHFKKFNRHLPPFLNLFKVPLRGSICIWQRKKIFHNIFFPSFSWGIRKKKPFCRIFTSKNGHLSFFRETALKSPKNDRFWSNKLRNIISLFSIFKMSHLQTLLNEYWLFYNVFKYGFQMTFHFQSQKFSE